MIYKYDVQCSVDEKMYLKPLLVLIYYFGFKIFKEEEEEEEEEDDDKKIHWFKNNAIELCQ